MRNNKYICFTLDLEEDHAGLIRNYFEGLDHLEDFIGIIKDNKIDVSFFIQSLLIERFPELIELLAENKFDLHLHSYSHSINRFKNSVNERFEIQKSKEIYRCFFNSDPIGYRFPLGIINDNHYFLLKEFGFKFDSSVFPMIRPGYFNNLNKPLFPHIVNGIVEIPFSVISRTIRIPVSLSYLKILYPLHIMKRYNNQYIIFDFHMHDLYNLNSRMQLPFSKRIPYLRNSKNGLNLFLRFHGKLLNEGYKSISILKMYELIKNGKI